MADRFDVVIDHDKDGRVVSVHLDGIDLSQYLHPDGVAIAYEDYGWSVVTLRLGRRARTVTTHQT